MHTMPGEKSYPFQLRHWQNGLIDFWFTAFYSGRYSNFESWFKTYAANEAAFGGEYADFDAECNKECPRRSLKFVVLNA